MSTNHLNRDALIIGICQYDDLPMSAQLDTLAKQAEQLAQLLETQGGFKVTRLPCAADLTLSLNQRVTLPELEQAIEKLLYPTPESPTQTALLFFAGHGLVKETKLGKEGFLATSEADSRSIYGFSLKTLRDLLRNSPIKQQIVFLESCHSDEFFTHFQADEKRDYCFVTSARAHEAALAEGLLTQALLDILDYTHQPKDTPWVNSDTLIENLQQQLTTTEGWQRFEMQTQGHLMLTNYAFSQQVDPNAKPYKGLHYFDNKPEDALFFKGRETLIAKLLTKVKTKPFLAILGASGNGKSSVVRAGVLYQLQQTGNCEIVNPFTPTATPLTALTNGLGTTEIVALVNASAKARVILTIDQFEEVFSLCQDPQARDTFFNTLLDAVEQAAGKLCLIVVMRADFMDKCSQYPRLASYFQDHQHIITRPTEAEIQQIIEAPAKQAEFLVEPRLVAEMVTDFKDSLGGLPLLEFALTTLWEKGKADRLLRYADYQALGRIQGILEKKATETYEKSLTPAEQVVAKRVFLELTELGEGKPDTRRLVPQTDLLGLSTTPTSVELVIAKLVKERLIVTDKTEVTVVNIAHDALIEHWSVLRKWLDQSREDLKLQRQINEWAKAWQVGKKALLVDIDLAIAENYLTVHTERVPLSESGVRFVEASIALREQEQRLLERLQRSFLGKMLKLFTDDGNLGHRDALVVGIRQYDDLKMSKELDDLVEKVEMLAQLLERKGNFHVKRLPCTSDLHLSRIARVSLKELKEEIHRLLYPSAQSPTETALLFFAGHGLRSSTISGEVFLATSEVTSEREGLSLYCLRDMLLNSPVKQLVVFLESCYSGEFLNFKQNLKHDFCFVTSGRANEESLAEGLLAKALINIFSMRGIRVTNKILFEYLKNEKENHKGWQRFQCKTQGKIILIP